MKTILVQCPSCKEQHALRWYIKKGGKRILSVLCNRQVVIRHDKHGSNTMELGKFLPVDSVLTAKQIAGIPEHYTHQAKQETRLKWQHQFALMNVNAGDHVERNVELAHKQPKETKIKTKIENFLDQANTLDFKIQELENGRRLLRDEAHKLSAKLSELQTNKFEFDNLEES
jgi:antirestriction protein ArdC